MTVVALIGSGALWLLWVWLGAAIVASWASTRKGFGEKPGLATGLLLSAVGAVAWLLWPARARSPWRTEGPFRPPRSVLVAPLPSLVGDSEAGAPEAAAQPATHPYAVAALVLGILWLAGVGSVLAVLLGISARRQIAAAPDRAHGDGLALAGIVLGWVGLASLAVLAVGLVVGVL